MTIAQPRNGRLVNLYTTIVHYDGDSNRRDYDRAKTRVGAAAVAAARAAPKSNVRYNIKITPRDEKPKASGENAVVERFELVFHRSVNPLRAKLMGNGMTS